MSLCPMCGNHTLEVNTMRKVVEAAEFLIDASTPDIYSEDAVVAAAAVLERRVGYYRECLDIINAEEQGGEDAVQ